MGASPWLALARWKQTGASGRPGGPAIRSERKVDTGGRIDLLQLDIDSPNLPYGVRYQGSSAVECRSALTHLPIRREDFTFIDLGCGKGRCLLIASEFPFRRILGVEFSRELCEVARKNLDIVQQSMGRRLNAEVVCQDAAEFVLPDEPLVLYFYNPFDREVMQVVVQNVQRPCGLCRDRCTSSI